MEIETARYLDRNDWHGKDGDGLILDVTTREGKFGKEYLVRMQHNTEEVILQCWGSHVRQLAVDFKEKLTEKWVGKHCRWRAVEITNSKGTKVLGWHVKGMP